MSFPSWSFRGSVSGMTSPAAFVAVHAGLSAGELLPPHNQGSPSAAAEGQQQQQQEQQQQLPEGHGPAEDQPAPLPSTLGEALSCYAEDIALQVGCNTAMGNSAGHFYMSESICFAFFQWLFGAFDLPGLSQVPTSRGRLRACPIRMLHSFSSLQCLLLTNAEQFTVCPWSHNAGLLASIWGVAGL